MGIGAEKFTNLKRWYDTHGLVPRRKKSGGCNVFSSNETTVDSLSLLFRKWVFIP
jgi:hypothetical protein